MSRLTCKYDGDNALRELCTFDRASDIEADGCMTCSEYCDTIDALDITCSDCAIQKAFDKLAEYEDLEEKGLLLKLPCKIGDFIYVLEDVYGKGELEITEYRIECMRTGDDFSLTFDALEHDECLEFTFESMDIGRIVFLSFVEAEKELERLNNEKN